MAFETNNVETIEISNCLNPVENSKASLIYTGNDENGNELTSHVILLFDGGNLLSYPVTENVTASDTICSSFTENSRSSNGIYACTCCQKFSNKKEFLLEHVIQDHKELLRKEADAENFITKLQALSGGNREKSRKKCGRPKKVLQDSPVPSEKEQPVVQEPAPGPDGLFWCKRCCRYFKKPRQLVRHVCLEINEEDNLDSDEELDCDETKDFRPYGGIDLVPWSRRNKRCNKYTSDRGDKSDKVTNIDKNSQSGHLPIFSNGEERQSFGQYMNSIDFSYVEDMFSIMKKRTRCKTENKWKYSQVSVYSCNVCKKLFQSLSHVSLHCLTHTDLKPFACPECPYTTNSKGALYIHMRKHTGNVFRCSHCSFQTGNHSHLLEHEATHSSSFQLCELCKNMYKTTKSLINHVRRYHKNPNGKKYLRNLSSKHNRTPNLSCTICQKRFQSVATLRQHSEMHKVGKSNESCREMTALTVDNTEELSNTFETTEELLENILRVVQSREEEFLESSASLDLNKHSNTLSVGAQLQSSGSPLQSSLQAHKNDSLGKFLPDSLPKSIHLLENCQQIPFPETSLLGECQQSVELSPASFECLNEPNLSSLIECHQEIVNTTLLTERLNPSCQMESAASVPESNSLQPNPGEVDLSNEFLVEKCQEDPKSAETKLFEKCPRLQAYVCCLCSAIYIDGIKLKDHLKEHVSASNTSMDVQVEELKKSAERNDLDKILLDNVPDMSTFDKLLEDLYTSSLDMSWKMPELSVTIEYDPALFDSVLEDAASFPINEKFDGSEDLNSKTTEENVLKYFEEF